MAVAAAMAVVALPGVASAGGEGEWTQLSAAPADNGFPRIGLLAQPTVARFGPDLQVLWLSTTGYDTAVVDAAGATTTPATTALTGWESLIENPRLVDLGGPRFLGFSGLQDTNSSNPFSAGTAYSAFGAAATPLTVNAGSFSATTDVYAGYGFDTAVDAGGNPVWVGNAGTTSGIQWHVGTSPTTPAPAGSDGEFAVSDCCAYHAAAATDTATGTTIAAFYTNSDVASETGVWAGQILPTSTGWARAPGSAVVVDGATRSSAPDQRVAMTARAGGGVVLAYQSGYPSVTGIKVWRYGSPDPLTIPGSGGARDVSIGATADGRVWVAWVGSGPTVKAVRSNKSVTAFGAVRDLGAPAGYTSQLWKTAVDGATGRGDVIATAQNANDAINVFHQQVLAGLTVTPSKTKVARGTSFKVKVTDAGDPVKKAKVTFLGDTYKTDSSGKTPKITVPSSTSTGKKKVKATKSGYAPGTATVRVTK